MSVSVVILNWNGEKYLQDFLPGLLESIKDVSGAEVVVADNGSTDNSLKILKEKSHTPYLITTIFIFIFIYIWTFLLFVPKGRSLWNIKTNLCHCGTKKSHKNRPSGTLFTFIPVLCF